MSSKKPMNIFRIGAAILNPAVTVMLVLGLLLHMDGVMLIGIGISGYACWGVLLFFANYMDKLIDREKRNAKKKKSKGSA